MNVVIARFKSPRAKRSSASTERSMLRVTLPGPYEERQAARDIVERLMGRDPALRFEFIQNSAAAVDEDAIDA